MELEELQKELNKDKIKNRKRIAILSTSVLFCTLIFSFFIELPEANLSVITLILSGFISFVWAYYFAAIKEINNKQELHLEEAVKKIKSLQKELIKENK